MSFQRNFYTYIESGFPLIASFGGHVVSIVGHTSMNDDEVDQQLRGQTAPIHASELVDKYVVMDDNEFPYQFMARTPATDEPYDRSLDQIRGIVVPLPDEIYLRPQDVESFVSEFVWVVELSTSSLRRKDEAFGEILLDATAGKSDLEPIFIRIGSFIARNRRKDQRKDLEYVKSNPYSTFRQYRHNLGTSPQHA